MEELWKIVLSGTDTPIEGCESLTTEQATAWLGEHQEIFDEPNECGDAHKYILIPVEPAE
jgi:hypothetical protein